MFTKCYFHNTSSLTSPTKGKAALCFCCRIKAGEGGKSLWMHDRIYIKLFDFLAKEEMARYKQTFKGSLELLISNLFPLPLALLKITVLCSEWKVINISWKVDHGIRHFLGENSAFFRCDLSVPLPHRVFRVRSAVCVCVLSGSTALERLENQDEAFCSLLLLSHFPGDAVALWLVTDLCFICTEDKPVCFPLKAVKDSGVAWFTLSSSSTSFS